MLSQTQIASVWGPPCRRGHALPTVRLHGTGRVTVDPRIVPAVHALNGCLIRWNYRTRYADTGAYNCRLKTSGRGYSNHSYGTALDLNWQSNPYSSRLQTDMPAGMRNEIKAIRTNSGVQVWGWGGDWRGNKDAMHWEIVCTPRDLATGIRGHSAPAPTPSPEPEIRTPSEDEDMYIRETTGGKIFHVFGGFYRYLDGALWDAEQLLNGARLEPHQPNASEFMNYVSKRRLKDFDKVRA